MKLKIEIFLLAVLINVSVEGQVVWEWQNPLPTGNKIYCIDFVDDLTGWFGSSAGTILHTSDGGNSWKLQYVGIDDLYIKSIDFLDHFEGWAVGNYGRENQLIGYILHTTDGGTHWSVQFVDSLYFFNIITFKDRNHGWAGKSKEGKIYYTKDGGDSWKIGRIDKGDISSIVFLDTLRGWATGDDAPLIYSEDGGKIWIPIHTTIYTNKIFFSDDSHGWFTSYEKLYRTTDGGKTWLDDLPVILENGYLSDLFFVGNLYGWVYITGAGIYATTDGGWTWDKRIKLYEPYFFLSPYVGWIGFNLTWNGGRTVEPQKKGFTLDDILDVDFVNQETGWIVGEKGMIAKTTDGGDSWNIQESGTQYKLNSIFALNENTAWAVGWGGMILRTENGGDNWYRTEYLLSEYDNVHWAVTFIDSQNGWIVGGNFYIGGWILYTIDGGITWREQTPGVIPRLFDVTFVDENKGWAVAGGGSDYDVGTVYHTTNGGNSWISQIENLPYGFRSIHFINEDEGWVCGNDLIVKTSDGGENWVIQNKGGSMSAWDIFFIDNKNGWVCGIMGKLYSTQDGGYTWEKKYSGTNQGLMAIDFVDLENGWVVGNNGTILHTPYSEDKEIPPAISSFDLNLNPNFPNPFNRYTVIPYQLSESATVTIFIHDIQGKEVIRLVDKFQNVGQYWVTWDSKNEEGGDMTSGLYFYSVYFNGIHKKTGKMILVR